MVRSGGAMEEREAWLALNMVPHVGPATFALLLEHFGTAKRILKASLKALEAVPGVGPATAKAIRDSPVQETVARERKRMAGRDLRFVTLREGGYPAPLRDIPQPPPVLYHRGSWEDRLRARLVFLSSLFFGRADPERGRRSPRALVGCETHVSIAQIT